MLRKLFFFVLVITSLVMVIANTTAAPKVNPRSTAALIEIKGGIGPAVQAFIERSLKKAIKQKDRVFIIQMDTPGGLSKSMRGIIKVILSSPIPVISYVAPSGARAASAGTYILYASHVAAMAPGTNLGAATPVAIGTPGSADKGKDKKKSAEKKEPKSMKAINDARAYIRSLAQLRKRNVKWAEEAVTKAATLTAQEAKQKNVINIVAKNLPDLLKQANGMRVSVRGQVETLNTTSLDVTKMLPGWKIKFLTVITDPSVAYILLMIGFYGLFFEFLNPGFIVPGVAGAICLLVALYSFQLLPINYAGLGLVILGMAFIVGEAFIPSFGALGIGGVIALIFGSIFLMKAEAAGFALPIQLIVGVAVATLLFFFFVIQLAWRSRKRRVVSGSEALIGAKGVVVLRNDRKWLRVSGELWKLSNADEFSEHQRVRIVKLEGLVLTAEPIDKD